MAKISINKITISVKWQLFLVIVAVFFSLSFFALNVFNIRLSKACIAAEMLKCINKW